MSDVTVPHLTWPLRLDGTSLAVVEQDSTDEIAQSVSLLLSTTRATRLELPDYGIDDPTFGRQLNNAEVVAQIAEWEPRAVADSEATAVDEGIATLTVTVDG